MVGRDSIQQWESTGRWIGSQGAEEKGEAGKEAEKSKEEQFQSLAEDIDQLVGPVNQLDDLLEGKKHVALIRWVKHVYIYIIYIYII